jgi:deferrochelatase/peroxidase EfeB
MLNLADPTPIDESTGAYRDLLNDLQCNILSSNGRANTHYFFLQFSANAEVQRLLGALARAENLPTALALEPESSSRERRAAHLQATKHGHREPSPGFSTNLLLTSQCYSTFLQNYAPPHDPAFAKGMATRDDDLRGAAKLNDPPGFRRAPAVHALYIVGYDLDPNDWGQLRRRILDLLQKPGVTVHEECGYLLRHEQKNARENRRSRYTIEPFGYRDAISQPLFYKADLEARRKYQAPAIPPAGTTWSSFAPLSLVLVPDPHGKSTQPCGSYVVYRKLKQKVDLFYGQAARLSDQLKKLPNAIALSPDEVADRLIGRRLDGTTLDQAPNEPPGNDFTYDGSVCPRHAHARKVNPRTKYVGIRRIVRRATVFGPELERKDNGRPVIPPRRRGTKASKQAKALDDVGLLFFCCQADIAQQFEEIQSQWANDKNGGADTVIGQTTDAKNLIGLAGSGLNLNYDPVVEVMAGEYFFAPSISFFSRLK